MPPASYEQTRTTVAPSSRRCASALRISRLYSPPETLLHFGTVAFATTPVPAASAGAVRMRALASSHSSRALPQTALGKVSSSWTYPTRRLARHVRAPARSSHSSRQLQLLPCSQPVSQSSAALSTASKPRLAQFSLPGSMPSQTRAARGHSLAPARRPKSRRRDQMTLERSSACCPAPPACSRRWSAPSHTGRAGSLPTTCGESR
mmetsp:Transcript_34857/g.111365  ORF Transcript_34857/g.111365 Transcript_34857/m.111365 type:complete len:206 (+) Transcript_34857:90-707(+)